MELNKTPRWYYLIVASLGMLVLALGAWWLYLLTVFARMMGPEQARILKMLRWEGSTFLLLLTAAMGAIALLYWRDLKKTRALQALFASLTHELKTPLASMRLQAEVIRDLIADESHDHAQLTALTTRLIQDTAKFEHELDKGLQLARLEGQGPLTLVPVELGRFVRKLSTKQDGVSVEVVGEARVLADEMALKMVFRNLLENTGRHAGSGRARIELSAHGEQVSCVYNDFGPDFLGDRQLLGELFYKHDSKKGTGVGVYLIKKLMAAQHGHVAISTQGPLVFTLHFRQAPGETV